MGGSSPTKLGTFPKTLPNSSKLGTSTAWVGHGGWLEVELLDNEIGSVECNGMESLTSTCFTTGSVARASSADNASPEVTPLSGVEKSPLWKPFQRAISTNAPWKRLEDPLSFLLQLPLRLLKEWGGTIQPTHSHDHLQSPMTLLKKRRESMSISSKNFVLVEMLQLVEGTFLALLFSSIQKSLTSLAVGYPGDFV